MTGLFLHYNLNLKSEVEKEVTFTQGRSKDRAMKKSDVKCAHVVVGGKEEGIWKNNDVEMQCHARTRGFPDRMGKLQKCGAAHIG